MPSNEFVPLDGAKIFCVFHPPQLRRAGECNRPIVFLLPGPEGYRAGPHRLLVHLARRLSQAGFGVVRMDYRGRGDSTGLPGSMKQDCQDVLALLKNCRGRYPGAEFALWGLCYGGVLAWEIQRTHAWIRRSVLVSVFNPQRERSRIEKVRQGIKQAAPYVIRLLFPRTWKQLLQGAVDFGPIKKAIFSQPAHFKFFSPLPAVAGGTEPPRALMIFGEQESYYRKVVESFQTIAPHLDLDFDVIPGADHNFLHPQWEEQLILRSIAWLEGQAHPN